MSKNFIFIFLIFIILFNQILKLSANDDTYINSSNITYNEKENIVELAENSKINFKNINILIDKGIIDYNKNEFEVFGNFYLYEELTILSGQNLIGNTSLDVFSANKVSYIYNDDLKIDSENLDRDKNFIYFYNNFLTPCELEGYFNCPTWSLRIDKTKYNIREDKFTHFDTFLQIADYKIFYLPYFSHYGKKAPRKRGFLTPSIEFTIGGKQAFKSPYYLPLNENSDLIITPKFFLDQNLHLLNQYSINSQFNYLNSGGSTNIEIDNIKNQNNEDIGNTMRLNTKQVINKNLIFSASGVFSNSVSSARSINSQPIKFENISLGFENYNLIKKNDYLQSNISSVKSFDSIDLNTIPIAPNFKYTNQITINNRILNNQFDFIILKREESNQNNPSESAILSIKNEFFENISIKKLDIYNKISFKNSINHYSFNYDTNMNKDVGRSLINYSSDFYLENLHGIQPRIKFILPIQLKNDDKIINEDSNSVTFNYQNQYSDNRIFGNDLHDNTPRFVYGIESSEIFNKNFQIKLNQTYSFNKKNNFSNLINQSSYLSDYSLEIDNYYKGIRFNIDARLNNKDLSKKEMNYLFSINSPLNIDIKYNETSKNAFKNYSNDTKSLKLNIGKSLNENLRLSLSSELDLKNNYDPYTNSFNISLKDDCSELVISYQNSRFNDNFNTKPSESISLSFYMNYLGFFGYKQSTDLFFEEAGDFNYGL